MKAINAHTDEGYLMLQALYMVAYEIIHADGIEEERELYDLIALIRRILGSPDFSKDVIIWQFKESANSELPAELLADLSIEYRETLIRCAFCIACSDERFKKEEMVSINKLANTLSMPKGWDEQSILDAEGNIVVSSIGESIIDWACAKLKVEANADEDMIMNATNIQLGKLDRNRRETLKAINEAAAILLRKTQN